MRDVVRTIVVGLVVLVVTPVVLVLSDPGPGAQPRATSGASFTLAALRRDGIVIPFASHDGARWVNPWPAPGRRQDIPISVKDSPGDWWLRERRASTWTAWPMRGESRVIHVKSPVNFTAECQPHVGLQTDYSSVEPPVPPEIQPYPKDGLATAGDVLIEPVDILEAQSADWKTVAGAVAARVTEAETTLMAGARFDPPFTEPQRAKSAFTLEILFRSPGPRPGTTQLYFEGVKRYPRFRARFPSELLTYSVGYVVLDPQAPPKVLATVTLSDNKREGLVYTMVLGSFRLDGKLFWAVQRSAWGYERFEILEIADPEVKTIFTTQGGTCR